jgi:hypothetical protein
MGVSILVFVELALGLPKGHHPILQPVVSILVFVELALGLSILHTARISTSCFPWKTT